MTRLGSESYGSNLGKQALLRKSHIHVVCNGEIYNHGEFCEDLRSRGHRFATGPDTEVIVHLYEEYGDNFLQHRR